MQKRHYRRSVTLRIGSGGEVQRQMVLLAAARLRRQRRRCKVPHRKTMVNGSTQEMAALHWGGVGTALGADADG